MFYVLCSSVRTAECSIWSCQDVAFQSEAGVGLPQGSAGRLESLLSAVIHTVGGGPNFLNLRRCVILLLCGGGGGGGGTWRRL